MKFVRKVGLAVIAAAVLTAIPGAGTASAEPLTETTLCKTSQFSPYCASANRYTANTAISASSESVTIKTPIGNVGCSESTISGKTTAESGEPLPLSVSAWTLGGCKLLGSSCTATAIKSAPYAGTLSRTTENSGTLNVHSGGSGNPGWTIVCGGTINCTYTMEPGLSVQSAGNTPSLTASEVTLARSGFLCGKSAKFSGTYVVSTPFSSYLAVPKEAPSTSATTLCKAYQYYCEPANLVTVIEGKSSGVVFNGSGSNDVSCGSSTLAAETAAYEESEASLPMQWSSLSFSGCSLTGGGSCEVSVKARRGGEITRHNADGEWSGVRLEFIVNCESNPACVYELPVSETFMLFHGEPGAVNWNEVGLEGYSSGGFCSGFATLEGNYPLTSPGIIAATDVFH